MPTLKKLKDTIRVKIDTIITDFKLEFLITGKVVSCTSLLFDLPENAQRITLGENSEEKIIKIKAFEKLISLILPLGIVNQNTFYAKELKNVYATINEELIKNNIQLNQLFELAEPYTLEFYILSSYAEPSKYPDQLNNIWGYTIDLIKGINGTMNTDNVSRIGYDFPQFGFKILPLIIPFLQDSDTKSAFYGNLEYYSSKENQSYLMDELMKCKDGEVIGSILKALSEQELDDESIQDKVISIYRSGMEMYGDALSNMMKILKHFPNEKTYKIGIELVKKNNRHTSGTAIWALLNTGYPAEKITDILVPKLLSDNFIESESALKLLANNGKLSPYLPNSTKLLEVFVKMLENKCSDTIAYSMSAMLDYKYDENTPNAIINYLSHQNSNVISGILILISCLMNGSKFDISLFYSEVAKEKYLALLKHENQKIVENTLKVLQRVGKKEKNGEYINIFLNVIDFESNNINNLDAMRAINYLLPYIEFNDNIVENYKKALENTNSNYRVAALKGLRYSKDENLKKSLLYLKDDPVKDVRKEAQRLMQSHEDDGLKIFGMDLQDLGVEASVINLLTKNNKSIDENLSSMDILNLVVGENNKEQKKNIEKYKLL